MSEFIVISVGHTKRRDKYITLWNPNNAGYCYRLEVAGIYYESDISNNPRYYNSGDDTVSIPKVVLDKLSELSEEGYLDTQGMVVRNNAKNWKVIKDGLVFDTKEPLVPQYRGAPRLSD